MEHLSNCMCKRESYKGLQRKLDWTRFYLLDRLEMSESVDKERIKRTILKICDQAPSKKEGGQADKEGLCETIRELRDIRP